ncbi:MAG: hypothetical protein OXR73_13410, partial [Myxococcales bacterium]|nr:hypothetical protein [Myxococcales bacterium]
DLKSCQYQTENLTTRFFGSPMRPQLSHLGQAGVWGTGAMGGTLESGTLPASHTTPLADGPEGADHLFVLAHGSGQAMDDRALQHIAAGLGRKGIRVLRFPWPDMGRHGERETLEAGRGTGGFASGDGMLEAHLVEVVQLHRAAYPRLVVGGWSLGARIAVQVAARVGADAVACLSYPFFPKGKPACRTRVEALRALPVPGLIIQGSRDAFGNREQVRGYRLPSRIQLYWLEGANHALVPRPGDGGSRESYLKRAVRELGSYIQGV